MAPPRPSLDGGPEARADKESHFILLTHDDGAYVTGHTGATVTGRTDHTAGYSTVPDLLTPYDSVLH